MTVVERAALCVYAVFLGCEACEVTSGEDVMAACLTGAWSGIGLARLVRRRDLASSCSRGASDLFFVSWTGWSVSTSDLVGEARLLLGFGLFHSPRTTQETHTHHPHRRHAPRHSVSLSSCKQSLVSCFLSVVCLLSLVCPILFLPCFCPLYCLVIVFPPSVRLCLPVSICVYLCLSVSVSVCTSVSVSI